MNWWVLRRRLHVSWLIALLSGAVLSGVFLAQYTQPASFGSFAWMLSGIILILLGLERRYIYLVPVILVGGVLVGIWRGSLQQNDLYDIQALVGSNVIVSGSVREDVDTNASGQTTIQLHSLRIEGKELQGSLWISTQTDADIKRSDELVVEGTIGKGFGSFAGAMYQASITAVRRSQPGDVALGVRDWFADAIRSAVPDPEASLGIGYLVGQKRDLPLDLAEALQIAGLTHIVVASGYNLTILVRLARRLFERVSKYLSTLSATAMIAGFVAMTGMSPSMSRAGLVAGLSLAAWYYGRRFHPVVLLSFAAAVTVMVNPSYVWGDLGWQLSFAAFGGVMILAPLLQQFFFGDKKVGLIRQILGETMSAVIVTAPILINAFGQFSNVAVIANMLVLPLVPLAMLLTFLAGLGVLIVPALATIVGLPATWLLGYMTWVADYLSKLPWAVSQLELSTLGMIICYAVLVALCIVLWRITRYDLRKTNIIE